MKQGRMTEASTVTSACSEVMTFAAGDMKIVFEQPVEVTSVEWHSGHGLAWYTRIWAAASETNKARVEGFNVDCVNV